MIEIIVGAIVFLVLFVLAIPWFLKLYQIYLDWVDRH